MIKKHILKILVFITNISLAALGVCFLKSQADKKTTLDIQENTETVPVSQDVSVSQDKITADREQKLRDLNTSPKESKKVDVGTTTTTTTSTTKPTTSSSSSSGSSSKSSTKTKTS
jgi:hypothetical protein